MIEKYLEILKNLGLKMHFGEGLATGMAETLAALTLLALSVGLYYLVTFILKKTVYRLIQRTTTKYDDLLIKNKVLAYLCLLVPAILISSYLPQVLPSYPSTVRFLLRCDTVFEIVVAALVVNSILNTSQDFYNSFEMSKAKPLSGVIQVAKIILFVLCGLVIIAFIMGTSLKNILISLGTASAVLMLVFQDTIKGFVGSIQLSGYDMVRIGDWIVMGPADGVVQEINLTTVKVQNWDNTITTIPTYNMVSNPFTNWRGMSDSEGRRIARSINIDVNSIRYCTPEMLEKYKHYDLVKDYITQREAEIGQYNAEHHVDTSEIVNGRQQTNIGIFRAYIKAYIDNNPKLNHELTTMVRQLQPTEFGVPLQIYAFSADKQWTHYEAIQSDIFDHILAAAPMFDLKIFQKKV